MIDLSKYTDWELAAFSVKLNCWEWPEEFGECPYSADALFTDASQFIRPIQYVIEKKLGEKLLLKAWHLLKLGRTEEQFEEWWSKREPVLSVSALAILKKIYKCSNGRINERVPIGFLNDKSND